MKQFELEFKKTFVPLYKAQKKYEKLFMRTEAYCLKLYKKEHPSATSRDIHSLPLKKIQNVELKASFLLMRKYARIFLNYGDVIVDKQKTFQKKYGIKKYHSCFYQFITKEMWY